MSIDQIKEDVKNFGIIFNFKDKKGELKTGIIRKGEWKDDIFSNGWLPRYRRMTRHERRHL